MSTRILGHAAAHGRHITQEEAEESERRLAAIIEARTYLRTWKINAYECLEGATGARVWRNMVAGLAVIETVTRESDGRYWHHVSVSTSTRTTPKWRHVTAVKDTFIGEEMEAYSVFPPKDRYVNLHEVLHLWSCLDVERGEVLPQFEVRSKRTGALVV